MGLRQTSSKKEEFISKQLAYDYDYERKIIEQEEASAYGSRNNIFSIGKSINEMKWHKKSIRFSKAHQQIELFFGWLNEVSDKRTRVLGKHYKFNDVVMIRVPILEQYKLWKEQRTLSDFEFLDAVFETPKQKHTINFSLLSEVEIQKMHDEEETKWVSVPDKQINGLYNTSDQANDTWSVLLASSASPEAKAVFEEEKRLSGISMYEKLQKNGQLETFLRENPQFEVRNYGSLPQKLEDTFHSLFLPYDKYVKQIDEITNGRLNQYFLTQLIYKKHKESNTDGTIRNKSRITELHLLFVELDYYKIPAYKDLTPKQMVRKIKNVLKAEGFPPFTEIVYSGRGVHIYWKISPIGEFKLEKWQMLQNHLFNLLKKYGADEQAKDSCRVLKLVGSKAEVNGEELIVTGESFTNDRYDFDELFAVYCGEEWIERLRTRAETRWNLKTYANEQKAKKREWMVLNGYINEKGNFTDKYNPEAKKQMVADADYYFKYYQNIVHDITTLIQLRNGFFEGYRRKTIFILFQYALRTTGNEIKARNICFKAYNSFARVEYDFEEYMNKASNVLKQFEKWKEDSITGYNYKAETLIELFNITRDEMKHLKSLVFDDIKHERKVKADKERITKQRRAAGVKSHADSKEERLQAILKARDTLLAEGKKATIRAIVELSGVPKSTVSRLLKEEK